MKIKLFKFIVPTITFIICILLVEFTLSFKYPKNNAYYVGKPNLSHSFMLDTIVLKGASGEAKSQYNSFGARSTEILDKNSYKILAFGGSTTECVALDQKKTWTKLLEKSLNNNDSIPFWVGNFGKSGNGTNHHILQTNFMLKNDKLNNAQTILYLIGFNDLMMVLQATDSYVHPDPLQTNLSSFMVIPDKELPLYRRTAIWKFLKHTKYVMGLNKYSKEELATAYTQIRNTRKKGKKGDRMPDLSIGLKYYKKNINTLINICKSKGKTPVFLTQPVLWRPDISEESDNLLYTFFQDQDNLNTETLYRCMKIFNNALIEECKINNVQCIDLFKYSKEDWFYDDCHLNEQGAYEVSKIIYDNIRF